MYKRVYGNSDAAWLLDLMAQEGYPHMADTSWNQGLAMAEEAMSETIDIIVWSMASGTDVAKNTAAIEGTPLSYPRRCAKIDLEPPGHNEPSEPFHGIPEATKYPSESLFHASLWVLDNGIADPRQGRAISVEEALSSWYDARWSPSRPPGPATVDRYGNPLK